MKLLILGVAVLSIETIYGQTVPATVNESVITAGTSYKRLNDGLFYPTGNGQYC